MPIELHPSLTPPKSTDRVWRYMDFAKYLSMLEGRSLYFSNVEALAKTDPYEGMLALPNFRHRDWKEPKDLTPTEWKELGMDSLSDAEKEIQFWSTKNSREHWVRRRSYDRRPCFVNCWHINENESAAMWSAYAPAEYGISLVSDYSRLTASLASASERLFAAKVQYIDFLSEQVDNTLIFPVSKRPSYSHENEVRLIYWDLATQDSINELCRRLAATMFRGVGRPVRTDEIDWDLIEEDVARVKYDPGRLVSVDIGVLLSEVRISPVAGDWFVDLVQSVSRKYSPSTSVTRSDLRSSPLR